MPRRKLCVAVWAAICATSTWTAAVAEDWPQWRGEQRDGVWRESGVVETFSHDVLPRKWSAPIGGGYSGPTVAAGRVYVADRVTEPTQVERVHCFDAATGEVVWTDHYDCIYRNISYTAGPRASVTVAGGLAHFLGAMGHARCYDAATGDLQWERDLGREYDAEIPIWGLAASPLVYDDVVIHHLGGADGACLVALDAATGREVWRALDESPSYAAPILIQQAGRDVVVVWTGDSVSGVAPRDGEVLWNIPYEVSRMVISVATPAYDQGRVFTTSFYDGSQLLALADDAPTAELLWRRAGPNERNTDALHSIISTPVLEGDYVYGVDSYGELRCLEAATGDRIWESDAAVPRERWATIHFVKHEDRWFLFNEKGELIIARLSPQGYEEISRAKLIDPTLPQLNDATRGGVCWSHPAFADRCVFARNDEELVCADLSAAAGR